MSRIITFSRTYPSYHPKAGQPTHFVEKVLRSVHDDEHIQQFYQNMNTLKSIGGYDVTKLDLAPIDIMDPKHHTIRAGHRWKAGDWFKPCVWSGKPYRSKMIQFAPEIQVVKTWDFVIREFIDGFWMDFGSHSLPVVDIDSPVAGNDGLTTDDFTAWFMDSPDFKKSQMFSGQIICWSDKVNYDEKK